MNKKVIIALVIVLVLVAAIGVGVYLAMSPQTFFPQAQQTVTLPDTPAISGSGASCPAPATPATVTLSYPLCEVAAGASQETCQFDKAGCVWESVSGASNYNIKITEVETGAVIKSDSSTATKTSFPVVQGRTYKCEVAAVNSCGTAGGVNEDTLLCETDAFVPSPSPSQTPVATPVPTPVPTPPPVACGYSGCSTTVPCQTGYICIQAAGGNYCTRSEYQSYCAKNPSEAACCQPPATPKPTLPPAGILDQTMIIGGAGIVLVLIGAAALLLL